MSGDKAIFWFIGNYPVPPLRDDGSVDYEYLCGEFLIEGVSFKEVLDHYDSLPTELKRPTKP